MRATTRGSETGRRLDARRLATEALVFCVLAVIAGWSAALVKTSHVERGFESPRPLMRVSDSLGVAGVGSDAGLLRGFGSAASQQPSVAPTPGEVHAANTPSTRVQPAAGTARSDLPADVRWFDGKPMRPARTVWMRVTAYSPDAHSCAPFDDGITASLKSVWTNGMRLVAADPRVLPIGSVVSVPGYASGELVPVLDKGGAIKGNRLDVLYPTHEIALRWGVKDLAVTVWEPVNR